MAAMSLNFNTLCIFKRGMYFRLKMFAMTSIWIQQCICFSYGMYHVCPLSSGWIFKKINKSILHIYSMVIEWTRAYFIYHFEIYICICILVSRGHYAMSNSMLCNHYACTKLMHLLGFSFDVHEIHEDRITEIGGVNSSKY